VRGGGAKPSISFLGAPTLSRVRWFYILYQFNIANITTVRQRAKKKPRKVSEFVIIFMENVLGVFPLSIHFPNKIYTPHNTASARRTLQRKIIILLVTPYLTNNITTERLE
jgi:hypothetical protein